MVLPLNQIVVSLVIYFYMLFSGNKYLVTAAFVYMAHIIQDNAIVKRHVEIFDAKKKRDEEHKLTAWVKWGAGWLSYLCVGLLILCFLGPFAAISLVRDEISKGNWVNVDAPVETVTTEEPVAKPTFADDEDDDNVSDEVDWDAIRADIERKRMEQYEEAKRNGTLDDFEPVEDEWGFEDEEEETPAQASAAQEAVINITKVQQQSDSDDEDFDEIEVDKSFYDDDKVEEPEQPTEKVEE